MASQAQPITNAWKATKAEIGTLCQRFGPLLRGLPVELEGTQLMWAFALNESIHEADGTLSFPPRFEPAYFSGRYAKTSWQAELNRRFHEDGAKSYGPWQVMLCNCKGFKPEELSDLEKCATAFLGYMNREVAEQKPPTLDAIADMYNSGSWKDRIVPEQYVARLRQHYFGNVLG